MISLEDGAKRHEKLFPNADLQSQIYKLEEEIKEVYEAETPEKRIKELSDVLIVCWGIYRFTPKVASLFVDIVIDAEPYIEEIQEQVEKKWLINEGRTWKFDGKVYHHVGKDGNE